VRPLVAVFLSTFGDIAIDNPYPFVGYRGLVSNSMTLEKDRNFYFPETTSRRQRRPCNLIFRPGMHNSWAELGIGWLFQRDLDFIEQNPRCRKETRINDKIRPVPIYDTVQAVISIGEYGSSRDNLLAHHCVQPIVQCNKSDGAYMWYLSYLANRYWSMNDDRANWSMDGDRTKTVSIDVLAHNSGLFFQHMIGFGHLDDVRNFVQQPFANLTRAMFANGAIRLEEIWGETYSPLAYWNLDELPGMCMGYTFFHLISN